STFKQMPMIFEPRQAGGVIGWTAAIAAFGPFLFGVGLTIMSPTTFYWIGVVWAVLSIAITWVRYARPGAPRPGHLAGAYLGAASLSTADSTICSTCSAVRSRRNASSAVRRAWASRSTPISP